MSQITAKLLLFDYKTETKKGFPIKIILSKYRKQKPYHLKIYSSRENWDLKSNFPNNKHPDFEDVFNKVEQAKTKINKIIKENCSIEQAIKILDDTAVKTSFKSLSEFAEIYFQELKKNKRSGTADNYKTGLNSFKNYLLKDEVLFEDVTYPNLKAFRTYKEQISSDPRKTASTIHNYFRGIRALWNEAKKRDSEILKLEYPFKGGIMPKLKKRPKRRSAEKAVFEYLYSLKPVPYSINYQAKDLALLCFLLGGIDFVDLSLLTWADIAGGRIKYYRHKLQDGYQIDNLIVPEAIEILNNYPRSFKTEDSKRIFAFIPLVTDPEQYNLYKSYRTRVYRAVRRMLAANEDLKDELYNSKYPRATFSTTGKRLFIDRELIKELMGHELLDDAELYKGDFEQSEKDQAILKITVFG